MLVIFQETDVGAVQPCLKGELLLSQTGSFTSFPQLTPEHSCESRIAAVDCLSSTPRVGGGSASTGRISANESDL